MKQKNLIISLRDFTTDDSPFGTEQGQTTCSKIQKELSKHPGTKIVGISFKGIRRIDVSFSRESVVNLAKSNLGEVGFYLKDFKDQDHVLNLKAAAEAKKQSIIILVDGTFDVIGPELGPDMKELLDFIMNKESVTTSAVVKKFPQWSVPNASGKLKKLLNQGLIIGSKETAETGGLEYIFSAIK